MSDSSGRPGAVDPAEEGQFVPADVGGYLNRYREIGRVVDSPAAELARLRAENERLTAARDRVLALCGEVHQDRIDSCGKVEDERLDVCVVRALLAPVSTDTDEPREG